MTLKNIVDRVKGRTHRGDTTITTDTTTQQIIDAVNDARRDVIRLLPKDWLRTTGTVTTANGTSTYDLPADCQEPVLFRYTSSSADYIIAKINSEREFYLQMYGSTVSNNLPRYYFDAGVNQSTKARQVVLFPTPNAVYSITVTYMMDPTTTDLSTSDLNTALAVFPSYTQDVLWKGARYYFLKNFDDPLIADAEKDYKEAMLSIGEADDRDLDADIQFRFDMGNRLAQYRDPGTGIRLK